MAGYKHNDVQQSLLQEVNLVTRHYFHQSIDEIMNDLHCRSNCVQNTTQPDAILKTIYHSGVLFQRSDKIVSQVRDAVARYVHGTYGRCENCGGEIPSSQLVDTPTCNLCPRCIRDRYSSVFVEGEMN